jgi:hypothetical protein
VALLQLFPLVRTTSVDTFRRATPWVQRLAPGTAVFHTLDPRPVWEPVPDFRFPGDQRDVISYASALDLDAVPGMFYGLTFPLAADPEGLSSSLHTFLGVELALAEWRERVPWLRALGVEYFVTHRPLDDPTGVELVAEEPRFGARSFLYRVQGPAPPVWWPRRVVASPGPRAAFVQVSRLADPVATVVAAETFEQPPGGRATIVEEGADRVVLEVDSPGGLVVLRRSYHPLYRVRAGDRELATEPVNLTLLGITVPPGRHRVVVDVDGAPEALAAGAGGLAALAALLAGLLRRPGRAAPSPRAGEGTAAGQGAARVVEPEPVAGGGASSA